jgi:hypothetical protein
MVKHGFIHSLELIRPFKVSVINLLRSFVLIKLTLENKRSQTQLDCGKDNIVKINSDKLVNNFSCDFK